MFKGIWIADKEVFMWGLSDKIKFHIRDVESRFGSGTKTSLHQIQSKNVFFFLS